jgi:hypothetical protein
MVGPASRGRWAVHFSQRHQHDDYYDEEVVDACQVVIAAGLEFEELARHNRPPPRSTTGH